MAVWVGRRMIPQVTAVGKALICHLDQQELKKIMAEHRVRHASPKTNTSLAKLLSDLATTRQRGYAIDDEEHAAGVRCLAAPVLSASGEVVAAIGVSGTVSQLNDTYLPVVGGIVRSAALKLSAQLGSRAGR